MLTLKSIIGKKVKLSDGNIVTLKDYPYTRDFLLNNIKEIVDEIEYDDKKITKGILFETVSGDIGIIDSLHYSHIKSNSGAKIPYNQIVAVKTNARM